MSLPDLRDSITECLRTHKGARPLLETLAKYGFAPIHTSDDPALEMIVKLNIGGVVSEKGATTGISMTKWTATECTHALIPSSESVRLEIAMTLHAISDGEVRKAYWWAKIKTVLGRLIPK